MEIILKSTVMRTEIDGSQIDCRAERNITGEGKESLAVQLHMIKAGGVNQGGFSGTIHARSFAEMETALAQFTEALRRLRSADGK